MMIPGYGGEAVNLLRLWSAKAPGIDMKLWSDGNYLLAMEQNAMAEAISKILYPADNHPEGKSLRLRQQYFLVSASVQDIVKRHLRHYGTMDNFHEKAAIQLNDTHPALCVPELMRIFLDDCGYGWEDAWRIVTKTVGYTNHTVMSEALECWSLELFKTRLPRITQIVMEINNRFRADIWNKTHNAEMVERTAVVAGQVVRMANLCVAASHSVNGVSALHSEILKNSLFRDFFVVNPEKFLNVTNGIAHRRWLCQANPGLTSLIKELIGSGFVKDAGELAKLNKFAGDKTVLNTLADIKLANKKRLADFTGRELGLTLNPDSVFDVQVKRLHEYKRQLMNAIHIIDEYLFIKNNPNAEFLPKTYIFGAKAAPGYFLAKQIILLICRLADLIDKDPAMNGKLAVAYLEDYRVTLAELIMPASEISEQISLAGTEASGTGNMKLMLNGAITLGTQDGANVEIHRAVGDDNIIIFGLQDSEADALRAAGYNPKTCYNANPRLRDALDFISSGALGQPFGEITGSLQNGDRFMVMADFDDYCKAQERAAALYRKPDVWNKMSLANIAGAGIFAADRAVKEYAEHIWEVKPV
jgi:starch phosphorylase